MTSVMCALHLGHQHEWDGSSWLSRCRRRYRRQAQRHVQSARRVFAGMRVVVQTFAESLMSRRIAVVAAVIVVALSTQLTAQTCLGRSSFATRPMRVGV